MRRQFTATSFIIDQDKALLIFHKKQQKWLPPGGHIEPNELPHECAIREAFEETGYEVELVLDENNWFDDLNASSIPRPWSCQLERIDAYKDEEAHEHIDFVYLARPKNGAISRIDDGIEDVAWFTLEEIEALQSGVEIYEDTKRTLRLMLESVLHPSV